MAKSETIRVQVEPGLKHEAERLFSTLGLSPSEAIALLYTQVTLHQGLPFSMKIPTAETREALRQAREEEGLTEYANLEDPRRRASESCGDWNERRMHSQRLS